jgi:hypothetical protein
MVEDVHPINDQTTEILAELVKLIDFAWAKSSTLNEFANPHTAKFATLLDEPGYAANYSWPPSDSIQLTRLFPQDFLTSGGGSVNMKLTGESNRLKAAAFSSSSL